MSVKGIGVDIEDINRFRNMPYEDNKAFYERCFSPDEINSCIIKKDPAESFAVRFCAKEAFIKAWHDTVEMNEIEIVIKDKKPFILHNDKEWLVSLSHDNDKAVAMVILEDNIINQTGVQENERSNPKRI